MAENNSENAALKVTRFCVEQCEKTAPQVKNAVNDWQRMYSGFLDSSFKMQKNMLKTMGLETKLVDQVEEVVKSTTKAAMKLQKEMTDASIDLSLKAARSLLDKTEKT